MPISGIQNYTFYLSGYRFGRGQKVIVEKVDFGERNYSTQDRENPINGARYMGRDVRTPSTLTFSLVTNLADDEEALAENDKLAGIWGHGATDWAPGEMSGLYYQIAGRQRMIYGRPRRYAEAPDSFLDVGRMPISATFDTADSFFYEADERNVDMTLAPSSPGGFAWPVVFPLTFTRPANYTPPFEMVVGGTAGTPPVVTFVGPVVNPSVTIGPDKISLIGAIPDGGRVSIDARPWARTLTKVNVPGLVTLSPSTPASRFRLNPGKYDAIFTGIDTTGTSRCQVVWRNAYHSL